MGDPSTPASGGGWTPPSIEHLQILLPQYEISRLLGHGGMGAVYEGLQSNLDRKVAIKILPETLGKDEKELNFSERFKLEAKSMARMNHPGIISVYDFGETSEGQLYYVMEFIDGMDIHQYLKHHGGKLPQESAIAIIAHVLDALGYAHERGIVHRDIKPANVMIKSSGRVKVADFGLVKRLSEAGEGSPDSAITVSNVAIGTPDFVAPESLEVGRIVDHRADLYSVGVMFYQLLTGSVPRGNFKPPSGRTEGLDSRLDAIVSRAMESEPDDRYASAEEFRDAIDEILTSPVPEESHTSPVNPEKKSDGPVLAGGKRLHLTSVQRKVPAPKGSTGPVKGRRPASGPVTEVKRKNPAVLVVAIVLGLAVIGGAAFFLNGGAGDGKGNREENPKVAKASGGGNQKKPSKSSAEKPSTPASRPDRPKPRPSPKSTASAKSKPKDAGKSKPVAAANPSNKPKKPKQAIPVEIEPAPAPSAPPKPATAPDSGAAVDLLAQFDPERDVVVGDWKLDDGKLMRQSSSMRPSVIQLAKGSLPPEYDVEFQLERLGAEGWGCNLGFVMSGYQGSLVIAGEPVTGGWWFEAIDGRGWREAVVTKPGYFLAIGEVHEVRLEVRKDRIAAFLDGEKILSWQGEPNRLSLFGEWPRLMPDADRLYFGAKGPFAIHKLVLIPKSAGGGAVTQFPAPDPNDPIAARLAEIDAKYRNYFEQPYQEALTTLNTQFIGALKREEEAISQTGDLDLVLAFENEIKRIGNGEGAGPVDAADAPPALKTLRTTWHTQHAQLEAARTRSQQEAHAKRDQSLDLLQQELVKAKDIEAAQRIKALRDRYAGDPGAGVAAAAANTAGAPSVPFGSGGDPSAGPVVPEEKDPLPGKLNLTSSAGAPKADLSAAEGIDDFVSVEVGFTGWAAIRSDGVVVSSLEWLDGVKDAERVIFETGQLSDQAWVIRKGDRVEGENGRGPNDLRTAVDFYHAKSGHGAAIDRKGAIDVWGDVYESTEAYEKPPETDVPAVQLASEEGDKEFRAHALLEDGSIISWGHRATSYPIPEGETFQAIAPMSGGVFVLTTDGRAFVCVGDGAIPFAVSRGPYTEILGHSHLRAARRQDGTWVAEGGTSQATLLEKINSFGPVDRMDFSGAHVLWIEPGQP